VAALDRKLLSIYLNDHLTALVAGVEVAKRSAGSNEGTPLGAFLVEARYELERDRAALLDLMKRLGIGRDRLKETAGWTTEKLGRLKLNGRIRGYSPLSRVTELEGLLLIVDGTAAMWRSLESLLAEDDDLGDLHLGKRAAGAEALRQGVEGHRQTASLEALTA
jgi:hypothetical protein